MQPAHEHTVPASLVKLGSEWSRYVAANANQVPAKGKKREQLAHAFAAGYYIAGKLTDGQMMLINIRGSFMLEEWARAEPKKEETV